MVKALKKLLHKNYTKNTIIIEPEITKIQAQAITKVDTTKAKEMIADYYKKQEKR